MVGRRQVPFRQIRAAHDASSIVVYQAYSPAIADPAVAAGRFVPPFRRERMTWIKPSFLWMMYRCGWATKPGQERVLRITMSREGFETILANACLSTYEADTHGSGQEWRAMLGQAPNRVQWDPERTTSSAALAWRSIQIGIAAPFVPCYVDEWIEDIEDITARVHQIAADRDLASEFTDREQPYPLPGVIATRLGMGR